MTEGMGYSPVYSHLGSQSNTRYHIPNLTYNMICKKPSGVILKHCVNNAVDCHDNTQNGKDFRTGTDPGKCIDSGFSSKGTHKDCTGDSSGWIGIRKPCAKRGNCRIKDKPDHNEE